MTLLPLLRKRRSIRKFESKPVEPEKIKTLVEALLRSPSSRGYSPWEFIIVTDREMIARLSRAKLQGSAFLEGAPLAIVVCGNPSVSDVWVEDCSIAAIVAQLTAESLGLSSCWAQIRKRAHDAEQTAREYVVQLLGLPDYFRVEAVLGIGYPAEEKPPHPLSSLLYDKIHYNTYSPGGSDGEKERT